MNRAPARASKVCWNCKHDHIDFCEAHDRHYVIKLECVDHEYLVFKKHTQRYVQEVPDFTRCACGSPLDEGKCPDCGYTKFYYMKESQ